MQSIISATIYCDFNKDWCNFAQTSNCDDKSKHGFIWERSTPANIKDRGIEGPDKGQLYINDTTITQIHQ